MLSGAERLPGRLKVVRGGVAKDVAGSKEFAIVLQGEKLKAGIEIERRIESR